MFIRSLLIASTTLFAAQAMAQEYPNRPVKIIVPYPVGGATDITARLVAERLTAKWQGSAVIVDNKPGVNGALGTDHARYAAPRLCGRSTAKWKPRDSASDRIARCDR